MHNVMEFLLQHGYAALFALVLAEQLGLPLPSIPFLIAAGALAGFGQLSLLRSLAVTILASLISDIVWFYFGKFQGTLVVRFLSWLSLKPEPHAAKTLSLLISKLVPGLSLITSPLAGMRRLAIWKFLALQATAALLWAASYMSAGWIFRGQLEQIVAALERFGTLLLAFAVAVSAVYIAVRQWQRRRAPHPVIPSKQALAH